MSVRVQEQDFDVSAELALMRKDNPKMRWSFTASAR